MEGKWGVVASTAQAAHVAAQDAVIQAAATHKTVLHALQTLPQQEEHSKEVQQQQQQLTQGEDAGAARAAKPPNPVQKSSSLDVKV